MRLFLRTQNPNIVHSNHPYYKVLLQYHKVLQSTTPVLFRTPVVVCATPYYKVLLQYYSVLQRSTPHYYLTLLLDSMTWLYYYLTYGSTILWLYSAMSLVYRKFLHLNFLRTFLTFASKPRKRVISEKKHCASYSSQFSASHPRYFPRKCITLCTYTSHIWNIIYIIWFLQIHMV